MLISSQLYPKPLWSEQKEKSQIARGPSQLLSLPFLSYSAISLNYPDHLTRSDFRSLSVPAAVAFAGHP
jgi:hypothetical protein